MLQRAEGGEASTKERKEREYLLCTPDMEVTWQVLLVLFIIWMVI